MTSLKLGRALARGAIGSALAVSMMGSTVLASDIDLSKWSPEYVRSIAGTETYDTVAGCNASRTGLVEVPWRSARSATTSRSLAESRPSMMSSRMSS